MAGIYCSDIFCDECIEDIKCQIWVAHPDGDKFESRDEWEEHVGYDNERDYDSDEYPKWCSDDEESDCPQHCGSHSDCLNPTVGSDGTKYGHFFGNTLTAYGDEYVKEAVNEDRRSGRTDSPACEFWAPCYDYIDYGPDDYCSVCGDYAELDANDECEECQ